MQLFKKSIQMRTFVRFAVLKKRVFEINPSLKEFQTIANQFGPRAVDEYINRQCREVFGVEYLWSSKSKLFRGTKIQKKQDKLLVMAFNLIQKPIYKLL